MAKTIHNHSSDESSRETGRKNGSGHSGSGRSGGKKPRRGRRGILTALLLAAVVLAGSAGLVRLFGRIDVTTSDIGASGGSSNAKVSGTTVPRADTTTAKTTTVSASGPYIQPAGSPWNLKLVNAWNILSTDFSPPLTAYAGDKSRMVDSRIIDQLNALVEAGKAHKIRVTSAYRAVARQTVLFNREVQDVMNRNKNYTRVQAEEAAATSVARPGTSEHNLGLAVDFLFENYYELREDYEKTDAYRWMMEHCAEYGFILRYPKGKQHITNVIFEPWHYRYVGVETARAIMSRGITLEEYLQETGR